MRDHLNVNGQIFCVIHLSVSLPGSAETIIRGLNPQEAYPHHTANHTRIFHNTSRKCYNNWKLSSFAFSHNYSGIDTKYYLMIYGLYYGILGDFLSSERLNLYFVSH